MREDIVLRHEFVEFIPDELKEGTIYISIRFATVTHLCCCGCGNKVVTPLRPPDWKLIFDGKTVSLDPSIGNWSFACKSHYWIVHNKVKWARQWSEAEIKAGRAYDAVAKDAYFGAGMTPSGLAPSASAGAREQGKAKESIWQKIKKWFLGK